MLTLNGWRRLGVVLSFLWALSIACVALFEAAPVSAGFSSGIFVNQAIPAGTLIKNDRVTLPSGKVVSIEITDPATGHMLSPWEIDWRKYPEVPKTTEILWLKLLMVALAVPVVIWLLIELFVAIGEWVARGFRGQRV